MADFNAINLRTNEYASGKVDQIELHAFDMWFYTDINSERDVKLAKRMGESLGIEVKDYRCKK